MNGESTIEIVLSASVLALATAFATNSVQLPHTLVRSPIFVSIFVIVTLLCFSVFPMTGVALFFLLAIVLFSRNVETTRSRALLSPKPNQSTVQTHPRHLRQQPEVLPTGETTYGETSIPQSVISAPNPSSTFTDKPRSMDQFQETSASNPLLGKIPSSYKGMSALPREDIHTYAKKPTLAPLSGPTSAYVNTHPVTERPEILKTGNTVYGEQSIRRQQIPVANGYYRFHEDHRSFQDFNETDPRNPVLGKIVESFVPANYQESTGAPIEGMYPRDAPRASSNPEPREYTFRPSDDIGSNIFVPINGPNIDHKKNSFQYTRRA